MFSAYLDFEISIGAPGAAGYPVIVHGPGGDASGELALPTAAPDYQRIVDRLMRLDTDEAALAELGQILFHTLFRGPIKEVYTRSQGVLTEGQGLRIKLNIAASETAVAALPWEFLCDPDHGYLALLDAPIVRYLPQQAKIPTLQTALPLKILLTAAQTPPPVDVERELRAIEAALADLGDFVQVTVEPHLTTSKLQRLLRAEYHVWHFVGHGRFDRDGVTGQLVFEDASRDAEYVSAPQLGILFNRSDVRLIVLDACHSAELVTNSLRSVAPALIRAQVPAVVAMQLPVSEEATRAFATEFYQALAEGFPIDACVTEGRKAVMSATGLGRADWGIPVTYTRAPDGMLFDVPPAPKPRCPYPGMVPFQAADARFFYGRDDEIGQMIQRLRHQHLLFVIGPSGSGKSSLVRAGLLPRLPDFWLVRELRPGAQPVETLAQVLDGNPAQPAQMVAALLDPHSQAQRLLLVIDQFEELFSQATRDEQSRFIAVLKALRAVEGCVQLIMLRADFYPDLMTSDLWPIDSSQRLEVAPLRGAALRQAIEQPAKDVGVRLEPGLIERLLVDAADEPGVLPLLQETMVVLWDAMPRRLLPVSTYTRLGDGGRSGLAVAIAIKADATLEDLAPAQQVLARRIFVRLVQFGEGRADTRRQQPVSALRSTGDDPALFEATLRYLTDNRLLTLRGEEGDTGRKVDIAHEALIAGWPRLQRSLTDQRTAEQVRRRLEAKAGDWVRLGSGRGGLLDADELPEAERWLASADADDLGYDQSLSALVEASRVQIEAEHRGARRRLRNTITGLAVGLVLVASLAIWGVLSARSAEASRVEAVNAQAIAEARRGEAEVERQRSNGRASRLLARQSVDLLKGQPDLALLLSLEGYQITDTIEIRRSLLDGLELYPRLNTFLQGHTLPMTSNLTFSPDGTILASGSQDNTIILWDVAKGQSLGSLPAAHAASVVGLAFTTDGKALVSTDADGVIIRWDVATQAMLDLSRTGEPIAAISPDNKIAANTQCKGVFSRTSKCIQGEIHLWDTRTGETLWQIDTTSIDNLVFSQDSHILASIEHDIHDIAKPNVVNEITLWDLTTHQPLSPTLQIDIPVTSLAFSRDGKTLALRGTDTVSLLDIGLSRRWNELPIPHEELGNIAFSPDDKTVALITSNNSIILWNIEVASDPFLEGRSYPVHSVAFSPDGKTLASGSSELILWDVATRRPLVPPLQKHTGGVSSVAFSPNGETLASGGSELILWNVATRQPLVPPLQKHTGGVNSVAFSPNGETLASGGSELILWNVATRQPLVPPLLSGIYTYSLAFSPDGKILASSSSYDSDNNMVVLWDVATQKQLDTILQGHTSPVNSVAFSADGKTLALGSQDHTIILWDIANRQPLGPPLQGHTQDVFNVAFSPDGKTLASGDISGMIIIWDVASHQPLSRPLQADNEAVYSVAFSPDGKTLASVGGESKIKLWPIPRELPQLHACRIANRNLTQAEWDTFIGRDTPYHRTCPNLPPGDGAPPDTSTATP